MNRLPALRATRPIQRRSHGWARRIAALCLAVWLPLAHAYAPPNGATGVDERDLDSHRSYLNRDGERVHSPAHSASGSAPAGASARCRDGTYSFSRHRRGTCSGHGGVAAWL